MAEFVLFVVLGVFLELNYHINPILFTCVRQPLTLHELYIVGIGKNGWVFGTY